MLTPRAINSTKFLSDQNIVQRRERMTADTESSIRSKRPHISGSDQQADIPLIGGPVFAQAYFGRELPINTYEPGSNQVDASGTST
jgi:hypothetical protein